MKSMPEATTRPESLSLEPLSDHWFWPNEVPHQASPLPDGGFPRAARPRQEVRRSTTGTRPRIPLYELKSPECRDKGTARSSRPVGSHPANASELHRPSYRDPYSVSWVRHIAHGARVTNEVDRAAPEGAGGKRQQKHIRQQHLLDLSLQDPTGRGRHDRGEAALDSEGDRNPFASGVGGITTCSGNSIFRMANCRTTPVSPPFSQNL